MSRRYAFRQVDVFAARPLEGNALTVFLDAQGLTDREMQALARETNLSETAFVLPPSEAGRRAGADYRLRIFTPGEELPFAGHPSVGSAWVLAETGRFPSAGDELTVRQEVRVGVLPLTLEVTAGRIDEVTLTTMPPVLLQRLAPAERDALAAALEVDASHLGWPEGTRAGALPAVISCGLPTMVVPFLRRDVLAGLDRRVALSLANVVRRHGVDTVALVAPGSDGDVPGAEVHVRVLCDPRTGIVEDPATGSAAAPVCTLLGELAGVRGRAYRLVIEQGIELGRPSRLVAEADFDSDGAARATRVAGQVVPVAEGWFELP